MPIYEYCCSKCGCQFETLVLSASDPAPQCPGCGGNKVDKLMSAGAIRPKGIPSGGGGFKAPKCAPTGG